jgi:hypothetical protein
MVAVGGVVGVHVCAFVPDARVMRVWFGPGFGAGAGSVVGLGVGGVGRGRCNEGTFNILSGQAGSTRFMYFGCALETDAAC